MLLRCFGSVPLGQGLYHVSQVRLWAPKTFAHMQDTDIGNMEPFNCPNYLAIRARVHASHIHTNNPLLMFSLPVGDKMKLQILFRWP